MGILDPKPLTLAAGNATYLDKASGLTKTEASTNIMNASGVLDVKSKGAKGDGVTDDTQAILDTFTSAATFGVGVRFSPGVYKTSQNLDVTARDNLRVFGDGATIDASTMPANKFVLAFLGGTATTNVATVTADVARGATTLAVSTTTGLTAGATIRLYSTTEVHNNDRPDAEFKAELAKIASVGTGTITLAAPTYDSYLASGTVRIDVIPMKRNVSLHGLTIKGGGAGKSHSGVTFRSIEGVRVTNVSVDGCEYTGIEFSAVLDASASGCAVTKANLTGLGYGLITYGCDGVVVEGMFGRENRHSVDFAYGTSPTRNAIATGCVLTDNDSAGLSTHGGEFITFANNHVVKCGGGIITRGKNTTIRGNTITGTKVGGQSYYHGITVGDDTPHSWGDGIAGRGLRIVDNIIDVYDRVGGYSLHGIYITATLDDAQIKGNTVKGFPTHGIYHKGNVAKDTLVAQNVIDCTSQVGTWGTTQNDGIRLIPANAVSGNNQQRLRITDNTVRGAQYIGIRVTGNNDAAAPSDQIVIEGNTVIEYGVQGVGVGSGYFGRQGRFTRNVFQRSTGATTANAVSYNPANWLLHPIATDNAYGDGQRFRQVNQSGSAPASGSWVQGDMVANTAVSEQGTAGSKYVLTGWVCVTAGSPGTWAPLRSLTGN